MYRGLAKRGGQCGVAMSGRHEKVHSEVSPSRGSVCAVEVVNDCVSPELLDLLHTAHYC